MNDIEFQPFPKIARYAKPCVVTEKLDGTNAQVFITDAGAIVAGSRNRYLTPQSDNFGFAKWVEDNKTELLKLGPGRHFGEWWGCGIQRGYGLSERRFSLFNVKKWSDPAVRPACCHVVPIISAGDFSDTALVPACFHLLRLNGSFAAPGFKNPEGIVVFHSAANWLLKQTFDGDEHKGQGDE